MLVLHDPATLSHRTVELLGAKLIPALESPERIIAILEALSTVSQHETKHIAFKNASQEDRDKTQKLIEQSHDHQYLEHLQTCHTEWVKAGLIQDHESILPECFRIPTRLTTAHERRDHIPPKDVFARPGYYSFDMSSGICAETWPAVIASANLAVEAAKHICSPATRPNPASPASSNTENSILALCRPPGHHCNTSMAGGYCYVNNIVVAVDTIRSLHSPSSAEDKDAVQPRIAILDIDFHHGNGTQDAFYADPSVLYLSIHGEDEYPYYSGFESELGTAAGYGFNCNFPLKTGSSFSAYLEKLGQALGELEAFKPEYLLVSLGFDTFHLDPIGNFKIETEDYGTMAKAIRSAKGVSGLPSAILLEGGYVVDRLGANLLSFLDGWGSAEKDASVAVDDAR